MEKHDFLKNFLDLDRGRDGDENFFLQIFFFIAITTAIATAIKIQKIFRFLGRRFFPSVPRMNKICLTHPPSSVGKEAFHQGGGRNYLRIIRGLDEKNDGQNFEFFWILIAVAIAIVMAMKKKFAKKNFHRHHDRDRDQDRDL
jgi:hypothetical protein